MYVHSGVASVGFGFGLGPQWWAWQRAEQGQCAHVRVTEYYSVRRVDARAPCVVLLGRTGGPGVKARHGGTDGVCQEARMEESLALSSREAPYHDGGKAGYNMV